MRGHIDDVITRTLRAQKSDTMVIVFQEGRSSRLPQTACINSPTCTRTYISHRTSTSFCQLVKKVPPHFAETGSSLPCRRPYPETFQRSPQPTHPISWRSISITLNVRPVSPSRESGFKIKFRLILILQLVAETRHSVCVQKKYVKRSHRGAGIRSKWQLNYSLSAERERERKREP
jgi:hypothetical protein